MRRMIAFALLLSACAPLAAPIDVAPGGDVTGPEVKHHVEILAADDMEGRGIGTKGIEKAADYIAGEMKKAGLVPGAGDSYFQSFDMTVGVSLGSNQALDRKSTRLNSSHSQISYAV